MPRTKKSRLLHLCSWRLELKIFSKSFAQSYLLLVALLIVAWKLLARVGGSSYRTFLPVLRTGTGKNLYHTDEFSELAIEGRGITCGVVTTTIAVTTTNTVVVNVTVVVTRDVDDSWKSIIIVSF